MPKIRLWPVIAIVLLASSVGLGLVVTRTGLLSTWDRLVSEHLHDLDAGWVHAVASAIGVALSPAVGVAVIVVWVAALAVRGRRLAALSTFIVLCAGWGCALVIKHLVDRPRPPFGVADGPSYPSGHTALATAIVFAAFFLARKAPWRDAIITAGGLAVVLVMFCRVIYGAHYLTDTIGAVLASSGAIVTATGLWRLCAPWAVRRMPSLAGDGETITTPARGETITTPPRGDAASRAGSAPAGQTTTGPAAVLPSGGIDTAVPPPRPDTAVPGRDSPAGYTDAAAPPPVR